MEPKMARYDEGFAPLPRAEVEISGDRLTAGWQDGLLLIGRVAIGVIFLHSGFGKVMELSAFTARMESMGVPVASVTAPLGAFVEFFGGLAIILGAWTWLAALLVAAFTVVATYIAHRYWIMPPEQMAAQQTQFMKNLAITGGLLAFAAAGPGRFSIDGWRWRRENGRYL
ncbi:DoxX family protein [Skermanella mucosa]|uniref:DoxX family protein n=1 Tax=Skermanella mucosa TaxID=1789672 RepID=UPI001E56B729|nr:DoxX family protein [Skermanella mucosa]UEM19082.1 DoxX family protein [Skermanella mucosa]